MLSGLPTEVAFVVLLFGLFVVPRMLQRYRMPSAMTALVFGAVAGMGFGLLQGDPIVSLLSTLGIVALFLFAGLEVQAAELYRERRVLIEHVVIRVFSLVAAMLVLAWVSQRLPEAWGLALDNRSSALVALALLTPSTGFILDSIGRWGLTEEEQFWIRSKAIATELIALAVLFIVLQSTSAARLSLSALAILAMIAVLPAVFRWFASAVVPHAPNSEFGFLMMVAAACAIVTRELGVYYLVGAFAVGMAAQQFRRQMPAEASDRMFGAVEAFASLFVPFYFFHAGLELQREDLGLAALGMGLAFTLVANPFRLVLVMLHRFIRLGERPSQSLRVGVSMLPTTVFTLVIAEILRTPQFEISPVIFGGLIVYTLINTVIPGFILRERTQDVPDEFFFGKTEPPFSLPRREPPGIQVSGGHPPKH